MKNTKLKKLICVMLAAVLALSSVVWLVGCSIFKHTTDAYADFSKASITIEVGASYDLAGIIKSNTSDYELAVSPQSVVSLKGTTVKGLKAGKATATLTTEASISTLDITVSGESVISLELGIAGSLIQTLGATSEVKFTPTVDGTAPDSVIMWYVNGTLKDSLPLGAEFAFTPSAVGEYKIKAACGSVYAEETVRVYREVTASGSCAGDTHQSMPFTDIVFTASVSSAADNPADYIEWIVDGESAYAGADKTYTYSPKAGTHTVTLKVNGVTRTINGESIITLVCVGSITPAAPTIEFDNLYPNVYIRFDVVGKACVQITDPDGTVKECSENDAAQALNFGAGVCNVGSFIDVCASGMTRKSYKFKVRSLGDGGAITQSDWSDELVFTQLPVAAKPYITDIYFDKDRYITSDEEYVNLLEYEIVYRSKTSSKPKVSFDCYLGYTVADVEDLFTNAFEIGATSGSYSSIKATKSGNVMHTEFTVSTVNNPTRQTYGSSSSRSYAEQLHAIIPHINYDEAKYRPDTYVFPIDKLSHTQSVTYSDELYLAAENNTKPVPVTGSSAAIIYEKARSILRKIISDDMTEMQKAHAIYDWVMWQVTYDSPATKVGSGGESYSAYYLEGVFGDGNTYIGGVKYYPYAVCDGMSKAYSLLCNIEGIACVRVAGTAGKSLSDAGGHAWNKVKVNGRWYIVDCTWGDSQTTLDFGRTSASYELGLHDNLFLTDAQADPTHFEPYEAGDSNIIYAPETTAVEYSVYTDMTYNGVAINCEVTAADNQLTRARSIASAFARAYTPRTTVTVPGGPNNGVYTLTHEAIEIHFASSITVSERTLVAVIKEAIAAVLPRKTVNVFAYDNLALIVLTV